MTKSLPTNIQRLLKKRLIAAGKWIKSCETLEQLKTVENYVDKISKELNGTIYPDLIHNLGIVDGLIISKKYHLKNNNNE